MFFSVDLSAIGSYYPPALIILVKTHVPTESTARISVSLLHMLWKLMTVATVIEL